MFPNWKTHPLSNFDLYEGRSSRSFPDEEEEDELYSSSNFDPPVPYADTLAGRSHSDPLDSSERNVFYNPLDDRCYENVEQFPPSLKSTDHDDNYVPEHEALIRMEKDYAFMHSHRDVYNINNLTKNNFALLHAGYDVYHINNVTDMGYLKATNYTNTNSSYSINNMQTSKPNVPTPFALTYRGFFASLWQHGTCDNRATCRFNHSSAGQQICQSSFRLLSERKLQEHAKLPFCDEEQRTNPSQSQPFSSLACNHASHRHRIHLLNRILRRCHSVLTNKS